MSILMKDEDNYLKKQISTSSIVDFAKEMALVASKSIVRHNFNNQEQLNNKSVITEEKEEQNNEIKSSFNLKRNIQDSYKSFAFQSLLSNKSLNQYEEYQFKKESKSTAENSTSPLSNTYQINQKRFNSDEFLQNKINTFLNSNLADADSSDETETCEDLADSDRWSEDLITNNNNNKNGLDKNNNAYFIAGKLSLYEKNKRKMNYCNAKLEKKRNKKIENMINQLQNTPEITDKSRMIIEKMNNYIPLYLRAEQLHSRKKTASRIEEKKKEMNHNRNKKSDYKHSIHEELKLKPLNEDGYDFIFRQEKWNEYIIHKKKARKHQKTNSKIENTFHPHINAMNNSITLKFTNENGHKNNSHHSQIENVFNRLYIDKEQHNSRQQYRNDESKYCFNPQLNKYIPSYLKKKKTTAIYYKNNKDNSTNEVIKSKDNQTEFSKSNQSLLNKQLMEKTITLALIRKNNNQTMYEDNIKGIKSRNINKSTGEVGQLKQYNDEEDVFAQYNLALHNQINNCKHKMPKFSRINSDNNTATVSILNHYLSKTKEDNINKSKKTLKQSASNITTFVGIPYMFKRKLNTVKTIDSRNLITNAQTRLYCK